MALQLKADPSQLVAAVAEVNGALNRMDGAAAKSETALEAIGKKGLPGIIPLADAVKQVDAAFTVGAKSVTALSAAQDKLGQSTITYLADVSKVVIVQRELEAVANATAPAMAAISAAVSEVNVSIDALAVTAAKAESSLGVLGKVVAADAMTAFAKQGSSDLLQFNTTLAQTQTAASEVFGAVSGQTTTLKTNMTGLTASMLTQKVATDAEIADLARLASAFESLQAQVTPAIAQQRAMANAQELTAAAVAAGIVSQAEAADTLSRVGISVASSLHGVGEAGKLSYMQVQELGHVTRSVAGVMMAGGSALQAFEFEATRIASVLMQGGGPVATIKALGSAIVGFLGPVGLGTVAVAALGLALYEFYPRAESAAEALKKAAEANDTYSKSFGALKSDMSEVKSLQDDYTAAVKSGSAATIAAVQQESKIRLALIGLDKLKLQEDSNAAGEKAAASDAALKRAQQAVDARLAQIATMKNAANPSDPLGAKYALDIVNTALKAETDELNKQQPLHDRATLEWQLIGAQIKANNAKLAATEALAKAIADGTAPIADNLNAASSAASGLANAMGSVAMAANATLAQMVQIDTKRRAMQSSAQATAAGFVGRPEQSTEDMVAARSAVNHAKALIAAKENAAAMAAAGGSGGGGASAVNQLRAAYQSLMASLDPVVAAQDKLSAATKTVNDAFAKGAISSADQAKALDLIRVKLGSAADAAKAGADIWATFETAGGSAIDKLIAGTGNLKTALIDMVKEMGLAIIKAQLLKNVTGGSSSDTIGGLIFKGLLEGIGGSNTIATLDSGGSIPHGSMAIVGEYGPELVKASAGGAVVTSRTKTASLIQSAPWQQQQPAQQAAPQELHVIVQGGDLTLTDDGKISARINITARTAGQQAVATVKKSLSGWNNALNRDGALA